LIGEEIHDPPEVLAGYRDEAPLIRLLAVFDAVSSGHSR
jgi:hypothetical protein